MLTNNSLIKKGEFFILQKRFSERFFLNHLDKNLNSDLLKTSNFSFFTGSSNVLNIKTSLYVLSKLLKKEKRKHMALTINSSLATSAFAFRQSAMNTASATAINGSPKNAIV